MLRKIVSFSCLLVALAQVTSSASANLLLDIDHDATMVDVHGNPVLDPLGLSGHESVHLTVSLKYIGPPSFQQSLSGVDFRIHTGSDSTFQAAQLLIPPGPGVVGGWLIVPPPGGTQRVFSGGPAQPFNFSDTENPPDYTSLQLGSIELKAGETIGSHTVVFTNVLAMNAAYSPFDITSGTLTYKVVPEPSSVLLLGLAVVGSVVRRRR